MKINKELLISIVRLAADTRRMRMSSSRALNVCVGRTDIVKSIV